MKKFIIYISLLLSLALVNGCFSSNSSSEGQSAGRGPGDSQAQTPPGGTSAQTQPGGSRSNSSTDEKQRQAEEEKAKEALAVKSTKELKAGLATGDVVSDDNLRNFYAMSRNLPAHHEGIPLPSETKEVAEDVEKRLLAKINSPSQIDGPTLGKLRKAINELYFIGLYDVPRRDQMLGELEQKVKVDGQKANYGKWQGKISQLGEQDLIDILVNAQTLKDEDPKDLSADDRKALTQQLGALMQKALQPDNLKILRDGRLDSLDIAVLRDLVGLTDAQALQLQQQVKAEQDRRLVVAAEEKRRFEEAKKAKEETERLAKEEQLRKKEAERIAKLEADRLAEVERLRQEAADRIAQEEADRKAQEEKRLQDEANRKAKEVAKEALRVEGIAFLATLPALDENKPFLDDDALSLAKIASKYDRSILPREVTERVDALTKKIIDEIEGNALPDAATISRLNNGLDSWKKLSGSSDDFRPKFDERKEASELATAIEATPTDAGFNYAEFQKLSTNLSYWGQRVFDHLLQRRVLSEKSYSHDLPTLKNLLTTWVNDLGADQGLWNLSNKDLIDLKRMLGDNFVKLHGQHELANQVVDAEFQRRKDAEAAEKKAAKEKRAAEKLLALVRDNEFILTEQQLLDAGKLPEVQNDDALNERRLKALGWILGQPNDLSGLAKGFSKSFSDLEQAIEGKNKKEAAQVRANGQSHVDKIAEYIATLSDPKILMWLLANPGPDEEIDAIVKQRIAGKALAQFGKITVLNTEKFSNDLENLSTRIKLQNAIRDVYYDNDGDKRAKMRSSDIGKVRPLVDKLKKVLTPEEKDQLGKLLETALKDGVLKNSDNDYKQINKRISPPAP